MSENIRITLTRKQFYAFLIFVALIIIVIVVLVTRPSSFEYRGVKIYNTTTNSDKMFTQGVAHMLRLFYKEEEIRIRCIDSCSKLRINIFDGSALIQMKEGEWSLLESERLREEVLFKIIEIFDIKSGHKFARISISYLKPLWKRPKNKTAWPGGLMNLLLL